MSKRWPSSNGKESSGGTPQTRIVDWGQDRRASAGRRIVYDSRMGKEIERKFLVRDDAWRDGVVRRLTMRQGISRGGRARRFG